MMEKFQREPERIVRERFPQGNCEAFNLCIKTGEEHTMVSFIIVIVETFVHVQHESSGELDYLD